MTVKLWRNWIIGIFLVGMKNGTATLEKSLEVCQIKHAISINPADAFLGLDVWEMKAYVHPETCTQMFTAII